MPKKPQCTLDDIFIYIFEQGRVRAKDLERAFVSTKRLSRATLYKYKRLLEHQGKIQRTPVDARPPYYLYSVPKPFHREAQVLKQYQQLSSTLFMDTDDIPWSDAPVGMYLTKVKEKILWRNDKTGAIMMMTKTPVGISSAVHCHPDANQWVMGIYGEVETCTGDRQAIEGAFSYVPKGTMHGARKVTKESLAYVYFDGPRYKHFAPTHPRAN